MGFHEDYAWADAAGLLLVSAGLAATNVDHVAEAIGLGGPRAAFGLMVTCCEDKCWCRLTSMICTMETAGQLVGVIHEYAERQGLRDALGAAIDQGRAWARGAPR